MTTVAGLDLSLTGTGVAVIAPERQPALAVITSKAAGPTIELRRQRLVTLASRVIEFIEAHRVGDIMFVVEQPAYAQTQGSQHDRSGLWWLIVDDLCADGLVSEVSPTALKKYATGKGSASKAEMMARTAQEFPGVPFESDNDSDALWLAALGRAHLDPDTALHSVTKARSAVLKGIPWATPATTSTPLPSAARRTRTPSPAGPTTDA